MRNNHQWVSGSVCLGTKMENESYLISRGAADIWALISVDRETKADPLFTVNVSLVKVAATH